MTKSKYIFIGIFLVHLITGTISIPQSSDPLTDELISEVFTKEPAVDVSRSGTEENVNKKKFQFL